VPEGDDPGRLGAVDVVEVLLEPDVLGRHLEVLERLRVEGDEVDVAVVPAVVQVTPRTAALRGCAQMMDQNQRAKGNARNARGAYPAC
jgi:carbon monoxide dehydrogenase subunit G